MSSNKKDKTPSKGNSGSSSDPRPTLNSSNKSKSSRKLPLPEIKIHPEDKPNPLGSEIDEPKAIPWGSGFESTSSTGSSLSDDDDDTVDDHTLSKNGNKKSGEHQSKPSCYDHQPIQDKHLLKKYEEQKEEIRRLRVENCLLKEAFAAYKLANPESSKKSVPKAKVVTPKCASPIGPSSPPLEWESSLIIEDYRDGLREENDPQSVATAEHSASDATSPKERDPHDWRTDFDFFLQQLEQRNSLRIQAETGSPTQSAGGGGTSGTSGTTKPVTSPAHSRPPFPKATPLTRPPPSKSPKSPSAKGGLSKQENQSRKSSDKKNPNKDKK